MVWCHVFQASECLIMSAFLHVVSGFVSHGRDLCAMGCRPGGGEGVRSRESERVRICIQPRRIISHWPCSVGPIDIGAVEEHQHKEACIV